MCVCVCVYVSLVPSKPEDLVYESSTKSSMTVSWKQSGSVNYHVMKYNSTRTSDVSFTDVGSGNMSATVNNLPTSGALYCISVTAVSGHLHSDEVELCNYTGEQFAVVLLSF